MIVGRAIVGDTSYQVVRDTLVLSGYASGGTGTGTGFLAKLTMYCDAQADTGDPKVKAFLYTPDGDLVGPSAEVVIPNGFGPGFIDLSFAPGVGEEEGKVPITEFSNYYIGIIVGDSDALNIYVGEAGSLATWLFDQSYADGPPENISDLVFDVNLGDTQMTIFGQPFTAWTAPDSDLLDDFYFARLPFFEAQEKFAETQPTPPSLKIVKTSWHGTRLDPEVGSFAVARVGGELEDWVGQRIHITPAQRGVRQRSVLCFVHTMADFDPEMGDLSLTRQAWMEIAEPGLDVVSCNVMKVER